MKKFFPRLSVKDICTLGLLVAITALLSIFCTFRIGNIVKIPIKFISVFVTAVAFGPVYGGICGAVGDLLNAVLAPVGPLLPQITALEFLSGFVYGLFFLKTGYSKGEFAQRTVLCTLVQFLIDMFLTTAVLALWVGYYPDFGVAFLTRLPAGIIKAVIQFILIMACRGVAEGLSHQIKNKRGK
ncbi:MAG: folate family ECF transporter S component [Clostridia bacterium]|nr:folate family ECF transporter S component [Clostridia bacterium]